MEGSSLDDVNFPVLAGLLYATLAQAGEELGDDNIWTGRIRTVVDIFETAVRMHAGDQALTALALLGLQQVEDIVNSEEFLQK